MSQREPQRDRRSGASPSRRRRYSAWSVLAPLALVVVVAALFQSISTSCAVKSCPESKDGSKAAAASASGPGTDAKKAVEKLPAGQKRYRVRRNDTAEQIAQRFGLTTAQLKACNPDTLADSYDLRAGEWLFVKESSDGKPCDSFDEAGPTV